MSTYGSLCVTEIPPYVCSDCPDPEQGRIDVIIMVRANTIIADPESPVEWLAAQAAGNLRVINGINGSLEHSAVTGAGYGLQKERNQSFDYTINVALLKDEKNWEFFNNLNKLNYGWKFWFGTRRYIYRVKNDVRVAINRTVQNALDTTNEYTGTIVWSDLDMPESYNRIPNFFELCNLGE